MKPLVVLIAALALLATACGGADDASTGGVASLSDLVEDDGSTELAAGADAAGIAGSGSSTDESASEESSDEPVTEEDQVLAFAQCLRDEGLDANDPTINADGSIDLRSVFPAPGGQADAAGQGGPPAGFREAFDECGGLIEGLRQARREGVDQTEQRDTLLEFAQCVRDNGFDMADPDFSGNGGNGGGGVFGDIDRTDPDFVAAQEVCQDILAGAGFGRRGGAGGPGGGGQGQRPGGQGGQGSGQGTP